VAGYCEHGNEPYGSIKRRKVCRNETKDRCVKLARLACGMLRCEWWRQTVEPLVKERVHGLRLHSQSEAARGASVTSWQSHDELLAALQERLTVSCCCALC
jgi:hypothetical protein